MSLRILTSHLFVRPAVRETRKRCLSFSFAGPRQLDEVLKKDLLADKSGTEIADTWFSYHDSKDAVLGLTLNGRDGRTVLDRAVTCPFFVQPIFREAGFFNLMAQFQSPSHFLLAYLEDYKMDPHSATPLLTFSVFDDFAESKDVTLVRVDLFNKGIQDEEGRKVVESLLDHYRNDDDYASIETFNRRPEDFDFDKHLSKMNKRWKTESETVTM